MRDIFIDVQVEAQVAELEPLGPDGASRFMIERSRHEAERIVAQHAGARLRTDRAPEIDLRRGAHTLLGGDWVLCLTRWAVVVPEDVAARVLAHAGPNRVET